MDMPVDVVQINLIMLQSAELFSLSENWDEAENLTNVRDRLQMHARLYLSKRKDLKVNPKQILSKM